MIRAVKRTAIIDETIKGVPGVPCGNKERMPSIIIGDKNCPKKSAILINDIAAVNFSLGIIKGI